MKFNIDNIRDIRQATMRLKTSSRGGGIEISLTHFGYAAQKMTAYQNYLGGGLLGAVQSDCTISDYRDHEELFKISEGLKGYFHDLTNPDGYYEEMTFEQNQNMPVSGY